MSSKLQQLHEAKTVKDVFDLVSWNTLQKLAAVPFMLFTLSPILLLIHTAIEFYYLEQTVFAINQFTGNYGTILLVFCVIKALLEHRLDRTFLKNNITLIIFASFILLICISTIVNAEEPYALGCTWRMEFFWSYILYVLVYFGCTALIVRQRIKMVAIRLFQIVALIQVFLVFFDRYFVRLEPFHRAQYEGDFTSVISNRNHYCYYLTIVILVSAALFILEKNRIWRIFDGICFFANTWTLMRADTLGCFLAALVGLVFLGVLLFLHDGRIHKTALILLAVFLALFLLSALFNDALLLSFLNLFGDVEKIATNAEDVGDAGTNRWRLWTYTIQYIRERPLLGWGSEGIFDQLEQNAVYSRPHNEYLQYMAFFGIPAGILYVCGVISVFLRGFRHRKELDLFTLAAFAGAFGYLVSACFGNTVFSVAPYFFCILGAAYRPSRK